MTIAQYKIRQYCKDNKTSMRKLSDDLGYSVSYLSQIVGGKLPSLKELDTINDFFGIIDDSKKISVMLKRRYNNIGTARIMYRLKYDIDVSYDCMCKYFKGRRPIVKNRIKALCKMLDLKNEWIEEYE